MKEGDIIQLAHVVYNIDKTMKYYWENYGWGPWDVYVLASPLLRDSMFRGQSSDHTYLAAVTWRGNCQFELIQPVTGRSIYDEYLERKGEGLHHLKLYYPDCQKALKQFKEKGIEVIQSGKIDKDEFYYLDTEDSLGYVIEIGNNGEIREPERRYPA